MRLIGTSSKRVITKSVDKIQFDLDGFLTSLLLFDHYVIDSVRLREIPFLVETFGFQPTQTLLNSDCFSMRCENYGIGVLNIETPKPVYTYNFAHIEFSDRNSFLKSCFNEQAYRRISGLTRKQKEKCKENVYQKLLSPPSNPFDIISTKFNQVLYENHPIILKALSQQAKKSKLNLINHIDTNKIVLNVIKLNNNHYKIETNLDSLLNISQLEAHSLVGKTFMSIAHYHKCLYMMEENQAIGKFSECDLPLIQTELNFLDRQLTPNHKENNFRRVIELNGLPNMAKAANEGRLDLEAFLDIRGSAECREFRSWLSSLDNVSDEEILDMVSSFQSKIKSFFVGPNGKSIRFLSNIVSGIFNTPLGVGHTVLDKKISNRFLKNSGPIVFLNELYPSIFERDSIWKDF